MSVADVSIVILVVLFAATALKWFDLGLGALAAAFFLGLAADVPIEGVTELFPGDFFILIVGVTALFAVAHANGTLDWLLDQLLRLVRGSAAAIALVPFVAGAGLTAVGTLPAAATAIVAPVALGLSARFGLPALMMAVVGIMGILSGLLSPLAVYGVTARELSEKLGMELPSHAPLTFLLGGMLAGVAVCAAWFLVAWRRGDLPAGRIERGDASVSLSDDGQTKRQSAVTRTVTVVSLTAVVVLSVGFDLNIGYLGIAAAVVQMLLLRIEPEEVISRIPWGIVLLIAGILTYVGLMQQLGAFERINDLLRVDGSPMLSLLVLCYIAGITSFAASSIAVFATTLPLIPSVVADGASPVGAVLAIALASVLVDINPLGITGGLILGSAEPDERPALFKSLLVYGLVSVAVAPAIAWAAFGWW